MGFTVLRRIVAINTQVVLHIDIWSPWPTACRPWSDCGVTRTPRLMRHWPALRARSCSGFRTAASTPKLKGSRFAWKTSARGSIETCAGPPLRRSRSLTSLARSSLCGGDPAGKAPTSQRNWARDGSGCGARPRVVRSKGVLCGHRPVSVSLQAVLRKSPLRRARKSLGGAHRGPAGHALVRLQQVDGSLDPELLLGSSRSRPFDRAP